ncbi:hypothetical protein BGX38DRAFT_1276695 [Terfezia claveryi]|nr:hypothetical protein BGX38DRAFT_1276695 [Terfezia claveryi]
MPRPGISKRQRKGWTPDPDTEARKCYTDTQDTRADTITETSWNPQRAPMSSEETNSLMEGSRSYDIETEDHWMDTDEFQGGEEGERRRHKDSWRLDMLHGTITGTLAENHQEAWERSLEAERARDKGWEEVLEERVKLGVQQALGQQEKIIEELEAAMEKKQRRKENGAKDGKSPEDTHPAKTQSEEDTVMVHSKPEQRMEFRKDSDKGVAPVTPPVIKKQTTLREVARQVAGPPQVTKHKKTYESCRQGVRQHESLRGSRRADTIQDVKRRGLRGIMKAMLLLGGSRRFNKTTSSVIVSLTKRVSFHRQESHTRMMLRGRWLPVEAYDFDRGRVRAGVASDLM